MHLIDHEASQRIVCASMVPVAHRFECCDVILVLVFFRRLRQLLMWLRLLMRWVLWLLLEMRLMLLLEVVRGNIVLGSIILNDDHVLVAPMALCR